MLQRHLFSHGFTPPLIALVLFVAIVTDAVLQASGYAKHGKCSQLGKTKTGFTLTVKRGDVKQFIGHAKTLKDCIVLSCKSKGANYAVLENGKCHALHCKKDACQIIEDKKSKQKIAGLARRSSSSNDHVKSSKHSKHTSISKGKSKPKKGKTAVSSSTSAAAKPKASDTAKQNHSNWTLAFSTHVVPSNKTNPLLTKDLHGLRSEQHESKSTTDSTRKVVISTKILKKTKKSVHKHHVNKSKKRTSKKSRKIAQRIHRKHTKRRSRHPSSEKHNNTNVNNITIVNNSARRLTRDYPYAYYQYQYVPSDKSYETQETDWRRDSVPTSDQSYADYANVDRESLYPNQNLVAPTSNAAGLTDNGMDTGTASNQLFSLPITSLVRRTEIPQGPHHISAISIVNDMLPDERAKGYLTDRDAIPSKEYLTDRDAIPSLSNDQRLNEQGIAYNVKDSGSRQDTLGYGNSLLPVASLTGESQGLPVHAAYGYDAAIQTNQYTAQQQLQGSGLIDGKDVTNNLQQANMGMFSGRQVNTQTGKYALGGYVINGTGIPLNQIASLTAQSKGSAEDPNPTGSPVVIGSDQDPNSPLANQPQAANRNDNPSTTETSSMESDLTDPDHFQNVPDGYQRNAKEPTNYTTLASVLPAKEFSSVNDVPVATVGVHEVLRTSSSPPRTVSSSPLSPSISQSEVRNPVSSLYAAAAQPSASQGNISPSTSSLRGASKIASTDNGSPFIRVPTGSPTVKLQQNDIDAPVQDVILPVGNKKEAYTESHSGDGQVPQNANVTQSVKVPQMDVPFPARLDVPFPARLVLPEPSLSHAQVLSGMSTSIYENPDLRKTESSYSRAQILPSVVPTNIATDLESTPTFTTHLDTTPTFSATFDGTVFTNSYSPVDATAVPKSDDMTTVFTTNIITGSITGNNEDDTKYTPTPSNPTDNLFTLTPSKPTDTVYLLTPPNPTENPSYSSLKSDNTPTIPRKTAGRPIQSADTLSSNTTYDNATDGTIFISDGHKTYDITTNSNDITEVGTDDITASNISDVSKALNELVVPTLSVDQPVFLSTSVNNVAATYSPVTSIPTQSSGHISPGTRSSYNDSSLKHIAPNSKPKLRISENGSVIVLNNLKGQKSKNIGIKQVYEQMQLEAKNRNKLRAQRLLLLKKGNGCNEALGMSNGLVRDDQLTSSSYLSPEHAPSKGRLGLQNGNSGGWCADPRLNNVTQYLQVDFRQLQEVCRVAMQGQQNSRNWITHYKVAFSLDGRHWSIYKEVGKEKVLQGNIGEDDWTSYRLINPIRTRFIRILPQAWEGNEICTRVEFYTENSQGGKVVYGRSSIPNAMQNMINDLSFEKVDNEVVLDSSPMGNNAYLNKGAAVYDTHGKCRHAARIGEGADILLDGRNMRVKPREAISISVWVRVDKTDGVHSIFDTVGASSKHVLGQYHFEIVGGAVRWFHRDENGTQIFSTITEPNLMNPREWTHIVASYDSESGLAKIYVNGSRVSESRGRGLLSQDWGGRVGIGRHKDTRDLQGDVDEFRIYNEAIQGEKILELSRECDFDKYYCGSTLTAERGILITPDYPSLHKGPVECQWEVKGLPGEIIALDVQEFDVRNCNASRLEVRDRDNDTLIGSYCGNSKPGRIESHGNQMIVKFTSEGFGDGERFKVEFRREKKRASKKTMSSICRNSDLYQNVTLVGGSKAGTFTDLGQTNDVRACQQRCCEKESCEIAFMIDGSCYGVHCFDQELCKIRKAKSSKLSPMLSFVSREGMTPRIIPTFAQKPATATQAVTTQNNAIANTATVTKQPIVPPQATSHQVAATAPVQKHCQRSDTHYNVTLVRGMKSGNFTSRGVVKNFDECFDKCCNVDNCDAAFMVKRTCFSIKCFDQEACKYKAARPSPFNPTLAYVIREKPKTPVDAPATAKSAMVESSTCSKSRLSKVYRNVTLRDGINSGEFTDRGSITNMDDCVKQCCADDNCNVAFVIKETCFTVKCKNYDTCSLKSAMSQYYNPRIAYVNWSPPKENLGEGDNRYDYKGCWRDFDMSAFAIPLLEGTDPVLTGPYKKRDDPVNDCATVSQHRGYSVFAIQNGGACFSGPNADTTYKRYGPSETCKGGRGGAFANSVYKLFDDGSVMSLGCWADLQDRAFRRLEKLDPMLQDGYSNRADPIGVCAKVAKKHESKLFALQKGGQCFISKSDPEAFKRYGPSRKCKYGLGGQMANDVYLVRDTTSAAGSATNSGQLVATSVQQPETAKAVLKNSTGAESKVPEPVTQATTTTAPPPTTATTTPASTTTQTTTAVTTKSVTTPTAGATAVTAATTVQATTVSNAISKSDSASKTSEDNSETLQPGEVVYKEQLTDTEHVKFIYSAGAVVPNTTLVSGISAGTFTDKGSFESMEECVKSCGETSNCDVAFKLGKQCFNVACYSKDTCNIKPAFSAFYNPLIAFVKHRTIKTQRRKEEAQLDSNPTQRSLCKAKNKVENVTLVDGIGAGNFTDLGHVTDMDDCISRCCGNSMCELAFRIEDDCYGVTCYSEHACRTRAARNALSLRPMIGFVRDVGSRQVLTQKETTKSDKKDEKSKPNKAASCSPDDWEGETRENVTLVGGINAGDFTDHGQTDTFSECMGYCCESKDCDLAFMIDKDCYGVKCKDPAMCKTRAARPTKYRPIIAFKKATETVGSSTSPSLDKLEQLFKTTENKAKETSRGKSTNIVKSKQGTNDEDDGFGAALVPVPSIVRTMFKDRTIVDDSSDDNTFAARGYYAPLTTNSPNKLNTATTTAKSTMTVIPRPPGTTPGFSSTLMKSSSSATPTFGDPAGKHSCEAGSIAYNATLKMGMHSGLFTKLGRVNKMDDCIERCCKSSNADVAFMLGSVCFAVKCYSPELCKIAPAMISNIGNLNMNPTLSFLKKKEATMSAGSDNTDIDVIIDEITDKSDTEQTTNKVNNADHSDLLAKLENISTIWEVHDRIRPMPHPPVNNPSQETCIDSPITYNVTLKGGIHAGNFTNQGEGLTPRECIGKCCDRKSCDLAFMFADLCYSVECKKEDECQAVVAKPSSLDPKVAYVSRNKWASDRGTMFDISSTTAEDEASVCDDAKLKHSPIMSNRTLVGGLNSGNFTYLGRTSCKHNEIPTVVGDYHREPDNVTLNITIIKEIENMRECLGKCCGSKKCDVAYRIDRDCFSVKCYSPELCKVSEVPAKNGFVQIATLTPMDKIRLNTRSVAVYVMLGCVLFTVLISGLGMALCSWRRRRQTKSQQQQTDGTPLPDR